MPADGRGSMRPARDRLLTQLRLPAEGAAVRRALAEARAALADLGVTAECLGDVELVLAEVLNNIVLHAYGQTPGPITLELRLKGDDLICVVRDSGRPMPGGQPPAGTAARLDLGPDALPEGGFGWFLIRSHIRALHYDRDGAGNRLTLHLPLARG